MIGSWPDVVVAALAGPLAAAGVAKLITPASESNWPISKGLLARPYGPPVVAAAEITAAGVLVLLPGRAAAALAVVSYAALAVAARVLRGNRCACFGMARLSAVGRTHIAANAAGGLAAAIALVGGPGARPGLRTAIAVAAAAATLGAVLALDRHRDSRDARASRDAASGCGQRVYGVRLYTSDGCPSCRSLRQLLADIEPARRNAVTTVVLGRGEDLPEPLAGLGVPAAVAVDATGEPVCTPVSGIGPVKALVDSVTLGAPVRTGEATRER